MTSFLVALPAEAGPLIEKFKLEPTMDRAFRVFANGERRLVISGVGKVAAAAAMAHLRDRSLDAWLNVGIAGHRDRAEGELIRASRVTDASTGQRYYPTLLGLSDIASEGVTTVDSPEADFDSTDVFDMEASGFYPTALRVSTAELVHVVKIVSDNRGTDLRTITAERVSGLVRNNLGGIEAVVEHLESLARELDPLRTSPELESFVGSWHFTTSQARRLSRLLTRLRAFEREPSVEDLQPASTASEVLSRLAADLETLASERQRF